MVTTTFLNKGKIHYKWIGRCGILSPRSLLNFLTPNCKFCRRNISSPRPWFFTHFRVEVVTVDTLEKHERLKGRKSSRSLYDNGDTRCGKGAKHTTKEIQRRSYSGEYLRKGLVGGGYVRVSKRNKQTKELMYREQYRNKGTKLRWSGRYSEVLPSIPDTKGVKSK